MTVQADNLNKREKYMYKSISVPGGGFVTGFLFHPSVPNILYCRTDIGGNYRYDFEKRCWISLVDHVKDSERWETYPLSIALDKQNPSYLYTMVGLYPKHKIAFSEDYGKHFVYFDPPVIDEKGNTATIHGNAAGRSTGERLVVDPNNSEVLYLGTMEDGLWKTTDRCRTWKRLEVAYPGKDNETNIAFVEMDPADSNRIIVATNGRQGSLIENVRGQSVYVSNDGGENFKPLKGEPTPVIAGSKDYPGYVGQRAAFLEKYLYISYAAYNIGWSNWNSYGCDTGKCYDGALFRFEFDDNGEVIEALDITPQNIIEPNFHDEEAPERRVGYGISGICADKNHKGTLICSTITSAPDTIYRSTDYGITWKPIMSGLEIGKIDFNVSYQRPEYNGNLSLIHWMSDLKINPFDSDMALFNTGAGIFMTRNLTAADRGEDVVWSCCDEGVEETVHLNVYSPPAGEVKVIDIIGDYGGFVFTDLDKPAENTFANHNKDRWITAMNADFPDSNPNMLVVAPRGNWLGKTKGGIIVSFDQGKSWEQLSDPVGLTKDIDELVEYIKTPNVTAGWAAVSSDGNTILWGLGLPIYSSKLVYTRDLGKIWAKVSVYDREGKLIEADKMPFKVMSDRVNADIFYGFSDNSEGRGFYVSTDKGAVFKEVEAPEDFPKINLAGIDSEQSYEIRVESGKEGTIWLAMLEGGLWKLNYDKAENRFIGERVSKAGDYINRIGLGKPKEGNEIKALYTSGTINGEYGFYRSDDGGENWIRINDNEHNFGDIRSISGDPRVFGRIYVATGTRGLVYGDIV
ncbi:endoglucanase [Clostridium sp. 19966]|uniref:VPS10 domain-containing protein n=1 Tax=Clostridium sp. 19966 TaxID=2768166 RepID=UPI0028DF5CF3|nr:endoglucanase [Clostridium sp. 19966]MDT8719254.1 endoglucanase [Clostridium sp. 19966]